MPDLSIVIVNYNTRDKLRDCIESILTERGTLDVEIIVVDNASQDGSADMLREAFAESVRLIEPQRNTWFSGGNNIGVNAATSDIVLLLNADTLIQPQLLQTMRDYLLSHADVGAVTCRQEHPDGELLNICSAQPRYLDLLLGYTAIGVLLAPYRNKRRQAMWYADWQRDSNKSIGVAPGSCIMTYRDLLLSFGVFDEAMRLYFTDDDLCRDILASGKAIHFLADVTLLHYEKSSSGGMNRYIREIYFDDMLTFSRKHFGLLRTLILRLLLIPTRILMDFKHYLIAPT